MNRWALLALGLPKGVYSSRLRSSLIRAWALIRV